MIGLVDSSNKRSKVRKKIVAIKHYKYFDCIHCNR